MTVFPHSTVRLPERVTIFGMQEVFQLLYINFVYTICLICYSVYLMWVVHVYATSNVAELHHSKIQKTGLFQVFYHVRDFCPPNNAIKCVAGGNWRTILCLILISWSRNSFLQKVFVQVQEKFQLDCSPITFLVRTPFWSRWESN